jgi:hypothetical protein
MRFAITGSEELQRAAAEGAERLNAVINTGRAA